MNDELFTLSDKRSNMTRHTKDRAREVTLAIKQNCASFACVGRLGANYRAADPRSPPTRACSPGVSIYPQRCAR